MFPSVPIKIMRIYELARSQVSGGTCMIFSTSGPANCPITASGMAHMYKKEIAVATISLWLFPSPLPENWDTRIDTPVPRPRDRKRQKPESKA